MEITAPSQYLPPQLKTLPLGAIGIFLDAISPFLTFFHCDLQDTLSLPLYVHLLGN